MAQLSAAQSRAADSTSVLSTVCRSNLDRLMSLSTSAVALCCSSASSSSRRSRTTSSWPEADELLWRTAFGAFALRLRALATLLLALERRLIAFPKAQDKAWSGVAGADGDDAGGEAGDDCSSAAVIGRLALHDGQMMLRTTASSTCCGGKDALISCIEASSFISLSVSVFAPLARSISMSSNCS